VSTDGRHEPERRDYPIVFKLINCDLEYLLGKHCELGLLLARGTREGGAGLVDLQPDSGVYTSSPTCESTPSPGSGRARIRPGDPLRVPGTHTGGVLKWLRNTAAWVGARLAMTLTASEPS
jgi:hypothetical protein